jgi:hypothetical protein
MHTCLAVALFATDFVKGADDSKSIAKDVFLILALAAVGVAVWRGERAGTGGMIALIVFGLLIGAAGGVTAIVTIVKGFLNLISGIGG